MNTEIETRTNEATEACDELDAQPEWYPMLLKAASDCWPFAVGLSNGQVIEAMEAEISGQYITLRSIQGARPEIDLNCGYGRGIQIHQTHIVWVAEADS